ncbi:MAG: type II secretion system F family protein [Chloroflexota bacterium]|nr:type II secretion system F family protein [Chloroflexota bacterium]
MTLLLVALALVIVVAELELARGGPLRRRLRAFAPRARAARRTRRVVLPGLVEAVAAALASGLSLQLAFAEIAPTLPEPLAGVTRRLAASLRLGIPLDAALRGYEEVLPAEDIAPLAIVLAAFARSGGRIGRSLGRVAKLLRGRLALEDEQAALTAQGRLSAIVLVALAPLGGAFFAVATPEYLRTLAGRGLPLLLLAIALEGLAAAWLWRLVRATAPRADFASLIDAVVVGLEAGLTFQQSLAEMVSRAPRVAGLPEARRLLADLALGRPPAEAFAPFAAAGQNEARVAALVRSAARFGAPLADLLVVQADALREADRRHAEAAARRLPVLMLFPLTFCVLPALLIVFLGPPLMSLL